MDPTKDPKLVAEAIARLERLKPAARLKAQSDDFSHETGTGLLAAMVPYLTENNLLGIFVYQTNLGGWHADLVLKEVPSGVSNVLGSPVSSPFRTKEEAEEFASGLLMAAFRIMKETEVGRFKAKPPVFQLGPLQIELNFSVFEIVENTNSAGGVLTNKEAAHSLLCKMVDEMFPSGITPQAVENLSSRDKVVMLASVHMAALVGVLAYPPRRDRSPSGHDAPSTMKH